MHFLGAVMLVGSYLLHMIADKAEQTRLAGKSVAVSRQPAGQARTSACLRNARWRF